MPFAVRAARARRIQLAAFAGVVGVLVAAVVSLDAATTTALDEGAAAIVAAAVPQAQGVALDALLAADPDAQDAAVTVAVTEAFGAASVTVRRSVWGEGVTEDGAAERRMLADPHVPELSRLVEGTWPGTADEVAVSARAAERTGDEVGGEIVVDGVPAKISGIWEPLDPADPAWFGEPSVGSGRTGEAIGPVLAAEERVAALGQVPRVRWIVTPASPITAGLLSAYQDGAQRLAGARAALDPGGRQSLRIEGELGSTMARASAAVAGSRAMLAVPLAVLLLVGAIVLGVLARTLARSRDDERRVLLARGASPGALVGVMIAETSIVSVVGALAGAAVGLAVAVAVAAGATGVLESTPATVPGIAVAIALAAVAVATASAAPGVAVARSARADAGRRSALALLLPLVAAVAVSLLASAQLLSGGLISAGRPDPLAASAPAATLLAASLLITVGALPVATLAERAARRTRGLAGVLAMRRLARQAGPLTAGVLSLALLASSGVFASVLSARVADAQQGGVTRLLGADVRAVFDIPTTIDERHAGVDADTVEGLPGVDSAFAVLTRRATLGSLDVALVAAPAALLAASSTTGGAFDVGGLTVGTTPPLRGGSLAVDVAARGSVPGTTVAVVAWVMDGDGAVRRVDLGAVAAAGRAATGAAAQTVTADVGEGSRLSALEVSAVFPDAAAAGIVPEARMTLAARDAQGELTLPEDEVTLNRRQQSFRIPTVTGLPEALPVVLTSQLAGRLAVQDGAELALRVGSITPPVAVEVDAIVPALPGVGGEDGIAVDLAAFESRAIELGGSVLTANELWIDSSATDRAAASVRSVAVDPVRPETAASVGTAAVTAPTIGLLAAGVGVVAVLAALAFSVVAASASQRRRAEFVPLRSFGFSPALQRRTSVVEAGLAIGCGLIAGALAGAVVAELLVPALIAGLPGAAS
ncbi:FtsX-like permease family protein [Microbacterium sp. P02]|uniref:FtsX-like permease family protein n=1 Tax=Microbacterium sp. P02 TaxID=3366260 RepID=UPI003671CA1D